MTDDQHKAVGDYYAARFGEPFYAHPEFVRPFFETAREAVEVQGPLAGERETIQRTAVAIAVVTHGRGSADMTEFPFNASGYGYPSIEQTGPLRRPRVFPTTPWPAPEYVECSNGCGELVRVLHEHELETGVTCDDCFERLTVPR